MHDHDEEEFLPEDEFLSGDDIILWTDRGRELGVLLGFSEYGLVWRRTHELVSTGDGEDDWELERLQRSVLTLTRWSLIDRIESYDEVAEEHELGRFVELLSDVKDAGDFAAVTEVTAEEDDE